MQLQQAVAIQSRERVMFQSNRTRPPYGVTIWLLFSDPGEVEGIFGPLGGRGHPPSQPPLTMDCATQRVVQSSTI